MIAKCIFNSGADLGPPIGGIFYTDQTVYHLRPGTNYRVWGLGIVGGALGALIWDDTGLPNWLPTGLFEITEQSVPPRWEFRLARPSEHTVESWCAIWGYSRLVRDRAHREGLAERVSVALDFFFMQVAEDALSGGVYDYLVSRSNHEPLQFSEFLNVLGTQLGRAADDPALIRPAAIVIQLLASQGDLLVGDVEVRKDGALAVKPWDLNPSDISLRIRREWSKLDEPKHVNVVCWLAVNMPR